jgi:hypothetical protein
MDAPVQSLESKFAVHDRFLGRGCQLGVAGGPRDKRAHSDR